MIELEIKCLPNPQQKEALLKDASFVSTETLTDVYYETPTYDLSRKDYWLRTRNNKFMLKIPATNKHPFAEQKTMPKHEIEDEATIIEQLELSKSMAFIDALEQANIKPRYHYTKTRNKYQKEGFVLDFDCIDYGQFTYDLCEVEIIVPTKQDLETATKKLNTFFATHNIKIEEVLGGLIYLIKKTNQEHYQLLQKSRTSDWF